MKNEAAAAMGRIKTEKKAASSAANGAKGGRPITPGPRIYWTASNNSSFLNGYRSAKTLRAAVLAARSYLLNELYGEGKISYYDTEPSADCDPCPIRIDEKTIFTGQQWVVSTDF